MPLSPRAQLLERNLADCVADRVLFVDWIAEDIAYLDSCGLPLANACVASLRFEDHQALANSNDTASDLTFDLPASTDSPFDLAILDLPKGAAARDLMFARLAALLAEDAALLVVGETRGGIRSARTALSERYAEVTVIDQAKRCALVSARRLTVAPPPSAALDHWLSTAEIDVFGTPITTGVLPGVFGATALDDGTRYLLETLREESATRVLDIGCGCGIIGAFLQCADPSRYVEWVDHHALAVAAARHTAAQNGWNPDRIYPSDVFSEVGVHPKADEHSNSKREFDLIVSNPPYHGGIARDYRVLETLITQAGQHLVPAGRLRFVTEPSARRETELRKHARKVRVVSNDTGPSPYRVYEATF